MKTTRTLVWDLPVRVFHWLLVFSFAGAFLTAESEQVRDIHVMLGYTFLGLLLFRLVWGFVGSRYARWRSFAFGPRAAWTYLRSLLTRNPVRHVGHNPAGSWYIYLIVALGIATGTSGLAVYGDLGGKWIEGLHEGAADAMPRASSCSGAGSWTCRACSPAPAKASITHGNERPPPRHEDHGHHG